LLTVVSSANRPRPPSARRRIEYKLAAIPQEYPALLQQWPEFKDEATLDAYLAQRHLKITMWTAADINAAEDKIGLAGSPTQVHKINFVVLQTTESKEIPPTPEGIATLVNELIEEYIIG